MVILEGPGLIPRENKIEKIVNSVSEIAGLSFLLGLTIVVCSYATIRNALEKTFDKKGYLERQKEKERIVNEYISALKQICGETRTEREERQFYEYLERQGISLN